MNNNRQRNSRRRATLKQDQHWLALGEIGTESLVEELDPILFAVDSKLSSIVNRVSIDDQEAAKNRRNKIFSVQDLPFAALVCLEPSLPWQLCYLTKKFNTYLFSSAELELLEDLASSFKAKLVDDLSVDQLPHQLSLLICCNWHWQSTNDLLQFLGETKALLAEDGRIVLILYGRGQSADSDVVWTDDRPIKLFDLIAELNGNPLLAGANRMDARVVSSTSLSLEDYCVGEYFASFIRRNREFFGIRARDFLEARMQQNDFKQYFSCPRGEKHWAIVIEVVRI